MARRRVSAVIAAAAAALLVAVVGGPAQAAPGDVVIISGTVTSDTGEPIAGQFVWATGFPDGFATATTDANGYYELEYTLVGESDWVTVSAGAFSQCEVVGMLSSAGGVTANCMLPTFYHFTISGTATTDDGSPHSAHVSANASDVTGTAYGTGPIQADGSYTVDVQFTLASGAVELRAPDGTVVAVFSEYADGDSFTGYDFTYHAMPTWDPYLATVTGTVTDKKGKPIEGATVAVGQGGPMDATVTTAADGTYVIDVETYWEEESADGSDYVVRIDGVVVEYIENLAPESTTMVDYRVGKTRVFTPWLTDTIETPWGDLVEVDILKRSNAGGSSQVAVCNGEMCLVGAFEGRNVSYEGQSPFDAFGMNFLLFSQSVNGQTTWWRADLTQYYAEATTFAPGRPDGTAWFDFQGDGPSDFVVWGDHAGQTTVSVWPAYDGAGVVTSEVIAGRFVSAEHLDLNAADGDELVLVTRTGNTYTVTLLPSYGEAPETVATGKGKPTVEFLDPDGDLVFDIVVTYPDRHKHRHHC